MLGGTMRALVASACLATCLAAPSAVAAPACTPQVRDAAGDTGHGPYARFDDAASDITAVSVAATAKTLTVRMTVAGQPDAMSVGVGRDYDVQVLTEQAASCCGQPWETRKRAT